MKKKLSLLFLIIFLSVILVSCGRLTSGVVTDKRHKPEDVYITFMYINDTMIPITNVDSESWSLEIEGEFEGNTIREWVSVDKKDYNKYDIGDMFEVNEK